MVHRATEGMSSMSDESLASSIRGVELPHGGRVKCAYHLSSHCVYLLGYTKRGAHL